MHCTMQVIYYKVRKPSAWFSRPFYPIVLSKIPSFRKEEEKEEAHVPFPFLSASFLSSSFSRYWTQLSITFFSCLSACSSAHSYPRSEATDRAIHFFLLLTSSQYWTKLWGSIFITLKLLTMCQFIGKSNRTPPQRASGKPPPRQLS